MSNVNAPNGFQFYGKMEGAAPTVGATTRLIAAANTTPIGYGDPVVSLSTGYIDRATAGVTQIAGIFYGCEYFNSAVGRKVWSHSWPGSSNTGDILAYLDTDPNSMYVAQASLAPVVFADIDSNVQFVIGTPATEAAGGFSTSSILSGSPLDTNTLPFRVVGLLSQYAPGGANSGVNGTDDASNYNRVIVRANYWDRTSLVGIA